MTYGLISILLSLVWADPLAGIAVGGTVGVVAALLCAALVGSSLGALRRNVGTPFHEDTHHTPLDHYFRHAA